MLTMPCQGSNEQLKNVNNTTFIIHHIGVISVHTTFIHHIGLFIYYKTPHYKHEVIAINLAILKTCVGAIVKQYIPASDGLKVVAF